ncbi:MAG: nucleoside-triphosphatase [Anaerolineae bacterium]|nr:nucleoside-triphosphatase [Anaerolineae bacterium]
MGLIAYWYILYSMAKFNQHITGHNLILLTGERQIGKSTVCRQLVELLRQANYQLSGLLTRRTGPNDLEVTELPTEKAYALTLPFDPLVSRPLGNFLFSPDALNRSRTALETCFPTQIFFLDELGPLELQHNQGWANVLPLLRQQSYETAVVVIRPGLLLQAMQLLSSSIYTVVWVREDNRNILPKAIFRRLKEKPLC